MLISADSHVVEPGDLWTERLPAHLQDRAPRAVQDPTNHHWYLVDARGVRGVDLTLSRTAGMTTAEVDAALAADPDADVGALGGSDAVARLRDLWRDDTVADVLYPTAGLSVLQLDDLELQDACCRAYNDWLVELCAVDAERLLGLAMIQTNDIERGVAELERTRAAGLRGAIIWTAPPEGDSFFDPDYEPLWAAAASLAMPISLHILAGKRADIRRYGSDLLGTFYAGFESRQEMHRSVCELIAAGVFERHPDLRVVAAEGGIEYAANLERRLDFSYRSFWHKFSELTMLPSEYFRRNVYLTYMTDPLGLNNLRFTGADHFMWSSDYPHMAAVWPESHAAIERDAEEVGGLDEETIHKLTVGNVARLYGIDVDRVARPSPVLGAVATVAAP
ncbi:MAG TPA: amidohydrolase family protein [Acidimicrobiia bacterium]|nr:amidohydrolase family protein [Acidimicrobiia bacterium]